MNIDKRNIEINNMDELIKDDATMYGEFVSSYFAWIPLKKQKERAEELEEMTTKKRKMSSKYK